MRKNETRLYNVLLPIWLLLVFPTAWLVVLPANFLIDSAVLLLAMRRAGMTQLRAGWKACILRVWLLGFLCDFAGAAFLLLCQFIYGEGAFYDWFYANVTVPVMSNPFGSVWGVLAVLTAVLISGALICAADRRWAFRGLSAPDEVKKSLALWLACVTAPWTFFLPSQWFWGNTF